MKQTLTNAVDRRIKRQSVPESLRDLLQERILNGEFKEGDSLIQDAIADEYDTSRMPVREALRQLEAVGLVSMRTHHGATVTRIPTEQIEELFELRSALECDILSRSIERITDNDIAEAKKILNDLERSYQQRDVPSWARLNWEFHRRLYLPANRIQTLAILQNIHLQAERYVRLHLLLTGGFIEADKDHREILRLCALRQTEKAVAALRNHIMRASRELLAELRKQRAKDPA
jgi:DNA-binding GntR family transcriptional regulator